MITLRRGGRYKLIETKHHTKVLYLDGDCYAWMEPASISEILVFSRRVHNLDCVLSTGRYWLYDVEDEPKLSDQLHLELEVGNNHWQGYLLLSGLPNLKKQTARIVPTSEIISGKSKYNKKLVPKKMLVTV